jgi:hypothetical protein
MAQGNGRDRLPLVQYWDAAPPPDDVAAMLDVFRRLNPDLRHLVFDRAGAERFVAAHYGERERAAFGACAVPAMQADYFRCCAVLALGGVYADADLTCERSLAPLATAGGPCELFGFPDIPPRLARPGAPGGVPFGDTERVGDYWFVNNDFFAFPGPGHPMLRLALDLMTANIEARATENMLAATSSVFTILYLLRELGSFDSFVEFAGHGMLGRVSRLSCEVVGDYDRVRGVFAGVRISPLQQRNHWVRHTSPPYKETGRHWAHWPGSIFAPEPASGEASL